MMLVNWSELMLSFRPCWDGYEVVRLGSFCMVRQAGCKQVPQKNIFRKGYGKLG